MTFHKRWLPLYVLISIAGTALLVFGLVTTSQQSSLVSGLCIGFGIILFSTGLSLTAFGLSATGKEGQKRQVEMQDERNVAIREKAAYRTGQLLLPLMGISGLALALADQLVGACVLAGLLLVNALAFLWFSHHYNQKL